MRHLSRRVKAILDLFMARFADRLEHRTFIVSDYPELYKEIYGWGYYTPKTPYRDIYENMDADIERYVEDNLEKYLRPKWTVRGDIKNSLPTNYGIHDSIDHYITDEEKEALTEALNYDENQKILQESLSQQRADKYIEKSGNDIETWKKMVDAMSDGEIKRATFEFQSAIDGINYKFKKQMVPRKIAQRFAFPDEHWKYREEMEKRRNRYRKYLRILQGEDISLRDREKRELFFKHIRGGDYD